MKTALVLSGGGAKGAFQAGALAALAQRDVKYNSIAGVSVGALNGVMVAAGKTEKLTEIWRNITQNEVYKKRSLFHLIVRYGFYKLGIARAPTSFYSNAPLLQLIKKEFQDIKPKIPITIGRVNLQTGEYVDEINHQLPDFPSRVLASTAIPVVWAPVIINKTMYVDGGVRNTTPLADAIQTEPDYIITITNDPLDGLKKDTHIRDIIDIAERSLDILLNEIFLEDIKRCMQINNLVKQADEQGLTLFSPSGKPYKHFKLHIISPPEPLGSSLDFGRERLDRLFAMGQEAVRKTLDEDQKHGDY